MPTYKEFSDRLKKARFSWQVKKIRDEVTKSGLPNRTINGLHERCQARLERYARTRRKIWDWINKWIWKIIVGLILLAVGIVLKKLI